MKKLIAALLLTVLPALATPVYVTQAGAGAGNGTSVANAYSAAAFNTAANWGGGGNEIDAGDVVYLSGTFTTRLTVQGSGTDANTRITITDTAALPAILTGITATNRNYIAVIGLEITHATADNWAGIFLAGCSYWLIQDNNIHDLGSGDFGIDFDDGTPSTYNIIRANVIDLPPRVGATTLGRLMSIGGVGSSGNDHNLMEYNTYGRGNDKNVNGGNYNIIRNNYFGPMLVADLDGIADPHIDGMQLYGSHAVFDRNFSNQNDTANGHLWITRDVSFEGWTHLIARFNVDSKTGGGGPGIEEYPDAYVYNNSFIDGQYQDAVASKNNYFFYVLADTTTSVSTFRNNSFLRTKNNVSFNVVVQAGATQTVVQDHNNSYPVGTVPGTGSLAATDPLYVNEATLDFRLQSGSTLRNAGGSLTLANGAGSSSVTLIVDDANYFCDGFGVADGDWISIGGGAKVQISAVNYGTDTITLATAATWSDNATVNIYGMTDMGGLPYGAGTAPAFSSGSITGGVATVTVADSFNVRFVEIQVDGLPSGTDYVAAGNTYSISGVPAGTVYTAVIYSEWASMTPTVEAQIYEPAASAYAPTQRNPAALGVGL